MANLPKFSDFTDISGLMNKVKSAIENFTGPNSSEATEEKLAKETNPIKTRLLEVELLINRLHEMMLLQNKIIGSLSTKYAEVKKLASEAMLPKEELSKGTASKKKTKSHSSSVNSSSKR